MTETNQTGLETEQSAAAAEQEPKKPASGEPQLSPRRRTALVTYLAILFAVAFLFVALMMVFETKRLKTMNRELQDSSQKNSATLTNNINALQAENQTLSERNEALSAQIGDLEASAASAEAEKAALQAELDRLTEEAAAKDAELATAKDRVTELEQRAGDAVRVSELLHQAMAADEEGNMSRLQELLDQIEPLEELLSDTEREIYEELKIA